jgi:hypothetical protein
MAGAVLRQLEPAAEVVALSGNDQEITRPTGAELIP